MAKVGPPFGSKNRLSHGQAGTRIYKIWSSMRTRCDSPKYYQYHRYGGRGITYDPLWAKFENFYKDMKDTYQSHLTLDRIDGDGNYTKNNCRWATWSEQKINTKKTHWITFKGQTKPLKYWATEYGFKYTTLERRINKSRMSIEKALLTPVRSK